MFKLVPGSYKGLHLCSPNPTILRTKTIIIKKKIEELKGKKMVIFLYFRLISIYCSLNYVLLNSVYICMLLQHLTFIPGVSHTIFLST